jgi:hypothetical protein
MLDVARVADEDGGACDHYVLTAKETDLSNVRRVPIPTVEMTFERSGPEMDEKHAPPVPPAALQEPVEDLPVLGEALKARADDVLSQTVALTAGAGYQQVEGVVQGSFERISISSTMAVSRWIAGEGIEVAVELGRETWEIFAELAAQRAATLDEVTRRCFAWRNVMAQVLHESAT